ncbi:hypothetical protein [Nodosilinea sp. E11]|uniref:slr1601 family putative cell division protein n=1 Tax=Nodosilinea sp. E11 TaxID=3037479 RepID=UPI00293470B5|nr:hypothetical protein [Nodosilinea sp. E11]WOD38256.1 hypothetical protein RRF56_18765 [Nodosilinea sp. E11]
MRRSPTLKQSSTQSLLPTPQRRRRRRQGGALRKLARHTPVLEVSARLGVNSFLALVAAVSLGRLVPHLQAQVEQLETVRQDLAETEATTTRLRSDFDRYFDPAQAGRVIQEQTGYRSESERPVVWTD